MAGINPANFFEITLYVWNMHIFSIKAGVTIRLVE